MFREWLGEMLRHSAFLGWAAEHSVGDPRNLAEMFLRNSEWIIFLMEQCAVIKLGGSFRLVRGTLGSSEQRVHCPSCLLAPFFPHRFLRNVPVCVGGH